MTAQERKAALLRRLRLMEVPRWLDDVDGRLREYIYHVMGHSEEGDGDVHNVDEVAACCRFLRMCQAYDFDTAHVRRYIRMAESLKLDSMDGKRCYRLTPSQVFAVSGIHGFSELVRTERYGKVVWERRKVVQEAVLFIPRKWSKTQLDAWEAVDDFLFGEEDAEVHVVSNSMDQSQIAFRHIRSLLEQIDPRHERIRMTAKEISWRRGRAARIYCHTAGGKTKDGAKASLVIADEYGSASYVKDHCDMSDAMKVYQSSMGPRRNPLTIITTTAGRVLLGPFEQKLREAQRTLYREMETGEYGRSEGDLQFLFALHPDEWEYTDACYATERLWRKVNPHLGVTIQSSFYRDEWVKAQSDPEHYKEVVTKLFNQFVSAGTRPWMQPGRLLHLQGTQGVRDLTPKEWVCFVAADFSKGDDLCTLTYLCINLRSKQYLMDCDAWIAEEQLHTHTNATLYGEWQRQGFLRVCPGSVIDEGMVLQALDEAAAHVRVICIGYDPYDSTRFTNLFREWVLNKVRGRLSGKKLEEFLGKTLRPVRQTWAVFNAPCQVMYDLVNWPEQRVWFSPSPLIPWCLGNCVLEEDRMGNVKPVKRTAAAKIDVAIGLLMGIVMMEEWKG